MQHSASAESVCVYDSLCSPLQEFPPLCFFPKIRRRQKSCGTALKGKSGDGEALRNKKLRVIEGLTLAEAGERFAIVITYGITEQGKGLSGSSKCKC